MTESIARAYRKLKIKKLSSTMVEGGKLDVIHIPKESKVGLKINGSWLGLCNVLLGTVYMNNKEKFLRVLLDNGVLSANFDVTSKEVIIYREDDTRKIYKIDNTPFYLVLRFDGKTIINAIRGMLRILEIDEKEVKLDILPLVEIEKPVAKKAKKRATIMNVERVYQYVNEGGNIDITYIRILNRKEKVDNFIDAIKILLGEVLNKFGDSAIKQLELCNNQGVGIVNNDEIECIDIEPLENTDYFLYKNNNQKMYTKYMVDLVSIADISKELVVFGVKGGS